MTTSSDDPEFNEWMAARRQQQHDADMAWLNERRDPTFDKAGRMHPDVFAWYTRLVDPEHKPGNLIVCGDLGVGKSWHLWRIFAALVEHHGAARTIEQVTAYGFKRIAAPPTDYDELQRLADVRVLFFDDIGSVRLSEWDLENLFGIVDQRWANQRPMVISSNALDLRPLFGDRIASRLADNVTLVELTGSDLRRAS
jgi:DNA replication protein DnaC